MERLVSAELEFAFQVCVLQLSLHLEHQLEYNKLSLKEN